MNENRAAYRLETIPEPPEKLSESGLYYWNEITPLIFDLNSARQGATRHAWRTTKKATRR